MDKALNLKNIENKNEMGVGIGINPQSLSHSITIFKKVKNKK